LVLYINGYAKTGSVPVNMNSTVGTFIRAYGDARRFLGFPNDMQLKDGTGVYYKR